MSNDKQKYRKPSFKVFSDHPEEELNDRRLDYESPWDYEPEKKFKDTALGRTLLLRNKTGKTIAGVLTGAVSVFTGFDITPILTPLTGGTEMDFLFDAGLVEIIITAVTFLFVAGASWLGAYFKLPKRFITKIELFLQTASKELEKAVEEESEKGRTVTRNEIYNGLVAAFRKTFKKNPEDLTSV